MFYAGDGISFLDLRFENDVKQYGTQATMGLCQSCIEFENDVKQYGTQATEKEQIEQDMFENDVKQYGTQANLACCSFPI